MLHQVSGRGALRLPGSHHPLLLGRGSLLRLRPRGTDGHPDDGGEPLLADHQRPRHPRPVVSSPQTCLGWDRKRLTGGGLSACVQDPDLPVHHLWRRLLLLRLRHHPPG